MNLQNPFPLEVRILYLDIYYCWICGSNGQDSGGLEIHHILGRVSFSAFNSCCLCKKCHVHVGHNQEEEVYLFKKTFKWLKRIGYKAQDFDIEFLKKHFKRLFDQDIINWLSSQ